MREPEEAAVTREAAVAEAVGVQLAVAAWARSVESAARARAAAEEWAQMAEPEDPAGRV